MKIIFLHTDFRVYWLPRLRFLNAYLKKRGHQLHVIEIAGAGSPYAFSQARGKDEISSWNCLFPEKTMREISGNQAQKAIFQALERLKPDVVFAGAIAYPSGASAVRYCRSHRIPVVIFDNARLIDVPRGRLVNFIKRNIYQNVDAVLIPAPSHCPDFEFWGFSKEQMYLGLNVVDNAYWKHLSLDDDKAEEVRNKFNLPEKFVLGVGRQVWKKNWISVIKAYANIKPDYSLLLVGDGPERQNLEKYIQKENAENTIRIIDFQPPEVLAVLYKKALATILASYAGETWGLTVNESMACGSPVIVSSRCGCCETLCLDGITGFKIDPSVESIANAFNRLSALSETQMNEMKGNAERIIDQWGVARFADSVLKASEALSKQKIPGFHSLVSRGIVFLWKGQYRPI